MCFLVFLKWKVDPWNFIMTSFPTQYHLLLLVQYISQSRGHISKDLLYLAIHVQIHTILMNSLNNAICVHWTVSHVWLMCLELSCAYNVTTIILYQQTNCHVTAQWTLLQVSAKPSSSPSKSVAWMHNDLMVTLNVYSAHLPNIKSSQLTTNASVKMVTMTIILMGYVNKLVVMGWYLVLNVMMVIFYKMMVVVKVVFYKRVLHVIIVSLHIVKACLWSGISLVRLRKYNFIIKQKLHCL